MLAALLGALLLFAAAPAQAQTTVWSATLTAKDILASVIFGCDNTVSGTECSSTSVLTEDQFTHNGVTYDVTYMEITSDGILRIILNKNIPGGFASFTLEVDSSSIGSPSVSGVDMSWSNTGLSWTVNQQVSLSLVEPPPPPYSLTVEATPPCGSTVTNAEQPTRTLVLTPAPTGQTETQYRWVADTEGEWRQSLPIAGSGRSITPVPDVTFAGLRQSYPGFKGFEYRLMNDHSVTAKCTWMFSEQTPNTRTPTTDDTTTETPTTNTGGTGTGGGGGGGTPPKDTPSPDDDPAPDSPRCGESDREDLESFYEATGGDAWDRNENWNSQETLDEWFGVDTDEHGNVVSLRLSDNGLSGEIPEDLCLAELKELALWDNDDLSGEVPEGLVRVVERAALRAIADMLDINPEWFEDYEDPFNFEDWHEGVTTDDEERVVELVLPGEIPESIRSQFKKREITITTSSEGGCALSPEGSSAFSLFLLTLFVFAVLGRKRAR